MVLLFVLLVLLLFLPIFLLLGLLWFGNSFFFLGRLILALFLHGIRPFLGVFRLRFSFFHWVWARLLFFLVLLFFIFLLVIFLSLFRFVLLLLLILFWHFLAGRLLFFL